MHFLVSEIKWAKFSPSPILVHNVPFTAGPLLSPSQLLLSNFVNYSTFIIFPTFVIGFCHQLTLYSYLLYAPYTHLLSARTLHNYTFPKNRRLWPRCHELTEPYNIILTGMRETHRLVNAHLTLWQDHMCRVFPFRLPQLLPTMNGDKRKWWLRPIEKKIYRRRFMLPAGSARNWYVLCMHSRLWCCCAITWINNRTYKA